MIRAALLLLSALLLAGCTVPPPHAAPAGAAPDGRSPAVQDSRLPVALDAAEREFVLAEMRQFVEAVRAIVQGIADNDMKQVASAARGVGMQAHRAEFADPSSRAAGVARKAPREFKQLGFATHSAFDEIAQHAEEWGDRERLLRSLGENLGRCVACHAAYRFPEARN